jgi:hypothetical protein
LSFDDLQARLIETFSEGSTKCCASGTCD